VTVIGVDVGGTKIKAGLISAEGLVIDTIIKSTFKNDVMKQIIEMVSELVMSSPEAILAIGVGTAGRVDHASGSIVGATSNLENWTGTPVKEILENEFSVPVAVDNDANAAAVAEGEFGSARGYQNYVCITLGTGVGAGAVVDGRLARGHKGGAGEVGHMVLYPNGHPCNCGRKGCLEQYVSGTALQKAIEGKGKAVSGGITPRNLFRLAGEGHPLANEIVKQFCDDLVIGLMNVHAVLDPEIIILGGGVVDSASYWWNTFQEKLEAEQMIHFDVARAHFNNDAGMMGAAAMAQRLISSQMV
jgi:glucokinase